MSTNYRLFLYSSDVGRLTFEADFETYADAINHLKGWLPDPEVLEERRELVAAGLMTEDEAGMWKIQERLNGHLRGSYLAYAHAYPHERRSERNKAPEGETIEQFNERSMAKQLDAQRRSKQLISHVEFPTREAAQLAVDRAIDQCAQDLDITLYGRIQRQQRKEGIHERFITDLTPFGFKVYQGDYGPKFKLASDTTIEELRAIRFPVGGHGARSREAQFTVESDSLRVTDPCYDLSVWCASTVEKVKNGTWFAHTGSYREEQCSWSKERWEKTLAEFEKTQEDPFADVQAEIDAALAAEPDEEKRQKLRERLERLKNFRNDSKLREFSDSYGNPDDWKGRIAYLHIRHADEDLNLSIEGFEKMGFSVGVDSGQAGFFDQAKFELVASSGNNHRNDTPEHEDFYEACGEKTLGSESWGVVNSMGAVSSSGYGDGGYPLYVRRDEDGKIVEARIVYISDQPDEEEGDEEGDEE